jgi:5-formyltetrahydrofolate cyclo-ligase
MTKDELRRKIHMDISSMAENARERASTAIAQRVRALPEWKAATDILGYLSMRREASVDLLLAAGLSDEKRVSVPAVDEERLRFRAIESSDGPFVRGAYGIREPESNAPEIDVAALTSGLVLVPGVGFDAAGMRLGRGGGYYDRLLAELPPGVTTVGIAFSCQLQEELPVDEHDRAIDLLATEHAVYRF